MNSPMYMPYKNRLENIQTNPKKRPWQTGEKIYKPANKKFKQNNIEISCKSSFDIVTLFKLEIERILNNTKLLNTTIDDIQPYGSRVSGIYTNDSDVDIHISYTSRMPIKKVIQSFANNLRNSQVFIQIISLLHAKIPIIKCIHRKTRINCDISFNNISAVHNSHLLNYIISMDHRVKPVLMKLKIWAKNNGLISTNGFSSYSFYWLGLFCMQVMGILPSIRDLQKSVPELIVGHWNCAFSKEQSEFIKGQQKDLSENDILNEIYKYYSSFNFESFVISPYTGYPLLKKDFDNVEQLPEELWRYKQFYKENKEHHKLLFLGISNFNMYTQDPFQHNSNITARVTPKVFEKFIKSCVTLKIRHTNLNKSDLSLDRNLK